jgi:hypothetical protein
VPVVAEGLTEGRRVSAAASALIAPTSKGAAVLALLTAYVGVVLSWLTYKRLVIQTAYEAAHNLQHFAHSVSYKNDCFKAWPDFSVDRAAGLLNPSLLRWTTRHSDVYGDLDHMIRNYAYTARYDFNDAGPGAATPALEYYVEHAIRLLIHTARFRGVMMLLTELEIAWISDYPTAHVRFRWERALEDRNGKKYRTTPETPLIAWRGSPERGRPSLGPFFKAMEDPPPKGRRPKLPRY